MTKRKIAITKELRSSIDSWIIYLVRYHFYFLNCIFLFVLRDNSNLSCMKFTPWVIRFLFVIAILIHMSWIHKCK